MLRFRDRDSYKQNKTKEYDDIAMKYLAYVLFFLVICSSIYSLKYERHKSWYSWILSSMTQCVYMFGKPSRRCVISQILVNQVILIAYRCFPYIIYYRSSRYVF